MTAVKRFPGERSQKRVIEIFPGGKHGAINKGCTKKLGQLEEKGTPRKSRKY